MICWEGIFIIGYFINLMFGVPLLDVEDNKKRLLLFFLIPMGVWFYLVIYGDK